MEKTIRGFFYKMNISRFLFYLFVSFSVLNIKSVQNEELVEIQSWAGFQGLNVLSVGAVANDCKKIFDSCRADSQKIIDDLNKVVESTQDAAAVPPKLWEALRRITDILQNGPKNIRFHFAELGDHFLKKLNSAISAAKSKNFDKLQDLQSIYDSGVDSTNESVLELEKSFSVNYNPNSILQQAIPESLNQASYSQSVAIYELKHLSTAVTEEVDNIEKAALKLLNRIYKGITLAKEVSFSVKKSGSYPTKYDEQYIIANLQSCSFLAKALKPDSTSNNPVSQPVSATPPDSDSDADPVIPSLSDETPGGDESGCGEIFRKSEKKIMQQLIITIKEIKPIDDKKEIDSRMFQVFKNYSLVLSNLNKKVITNVITVVNQFFQLYNIVLSILDKINPDMKSKAEDLLYLQDIDTTDEHYENINKYIVEDYLSSSKMNELLQRVDNHVKSMKSLSEIKKGLIQELSVITNELGIDLQTMKTTILYVFEELKKGVKALQNLKNKSNRTGFRYYLNFYRGKADLAQLKKLICMINSLKIELLLERQLFTDDEELEAFKAATTDIQNEIDQKNQKLLEQVNTMNDFNFVQGFVSKSVLDYNMCLETYSVESRTILKKVITKYVTIFEELIIIIKRRKIKNSKTIEDLYSNESSSTSSQDETVSKYLLEKTDIDIEKLSSTLNQEVNIYNKETVTQEIRELSTVTHSEVTKINQTVLKFINTMSSEIHNLKTIRDEASQAVDYEISDEKLKCISNIIQIIESLHIKSNKDEIQSLSIYFERVKEKIQMATQNFETQTSECVEMQQFKTQVETLKTSIFEALTKASLEINDKIRRVIFEYNEKLYLLQQNSSYCELNSLQEQESSFALNDYTRKYVTGYYTSDEIFTSLDTIMNSATSSDISQVKTDMYSKLDETNQNIESELEKIHDDLNNFVEKFSQGMQVLSVLEAKSQKQTDQTETMDQVDFSTLKEVDGMVKIIGKYVNVNAENSQRELKVQIDNARLQISNKFEQVSETLTSTQDYTQMESIMIESINSCETIFNELKNNTRSELTRSVEEFINSYQKTITTLHSQVSSTQNTILQDLNKGDCKNDDNDFQKYMQMMLQQDYQSSTTVSNTFEYMKKYNFVDSQNMKEKCTQVFQSLSYKMNMELDNISHVSKYVLENVQKVNNVLIKLENCENKQNFTLSLTDEELREFRVARTVNELWEYSSHDTTISSIGTTITNARSQIDLEYRKIQTKLESSTDQNVVQTEIESSLQNIQNIFHTTQTQVNEIVKQNVESFYTSMTSEINEFQSSGSSTLNTALQSVISDRSVSSTNQQTTLSTNVDFNSFSSSVNIQQIYNEIKTKTTENYSQTIENFKQVINEKFSKVEKTSAYVVENVQKGYSVMEEIKTSVQLDSNYQLTQYQEEQLRKCVSVSHKVGNLKVDAKTAQTTITNNINSVKSQISEEYTKINESVSSLTDEKSIQETVSKGVNKFEQLFAQAKTTVKEQLSLASSGFYSSYMQTTTNLENQNSSQVCNVMKDISSGVTSYQSNSDQSYMDTVSYFNNKSFRSCLSIQNWFRDIKSTTSMESFSTVNEKSTKELSSLNDKITSSFDKMESSSTYVLDSIQKSTDLLTQIEESVKQDATYQLTEEQITEFQKCISMYQSIQIVTTTSTTSIQESIQTSISDVKSKISSAYSEITQSISTSTDDNSITEIKTKGVQKFEQIFSQAKESVKEELFQSLNSFYTSFSQITTDSHTEFNQISSTLQSVKSSSNTYHSDEKSYQETISYFNSESFKSCVTIKNWFKEITSTSSSTTSTNVKETTINEFNSVNEKITRSLDELETSSSFILQTIESSTQTFKQIENAMIQGSTYQLTQEQITQLQKCMNVYQSVQKTVTSTSTFTTQQIIQSDITNVKEEINSAYSQISQSISSASDDNSVRQIETVGVDNYENIFSHATETIKEQLFQKSTDFYSMFTQLSTDMQQENSQSVVSNVNVSQSESDQSYTSMLSCFNNEMFTSTSVIKTWYSEIKKTTAESDWSILSGGLSGKVSSDFSALNDRVTKSVDSIQESSTEVLDTMKKGFETIKEVKKCMMQDSNYKMTQEQVTFLQKCVTVHQTIETVMTTTSTTETVKAKHTMESDISNAKSLITNEFNKATETIKSLTDESSINEAATKSITNMDQFFSQTKGNIQTVLSDSSNNFYNTYQKVSSMAEKQENSQIKQVLSDITNNQSQYQSQNDQSFSSIISYFNDSSYKSNSVIQNWYNEIKSTSSTSESANFSENTINKLSTLNQRVTKSIDSMQQTSSSVIDTIEKGSEVLKQIEESTTKNSSYQLSQDQVTYLQKCITIYQTIQTVTTTTTTTTSTTSTAKQTITSDIQNVKSKITDEFTNVSESLKSLTDENSIKQVVDDNVNKVDQCYSETKQKVQTELKKASSDFFNTYQQISSNLDKQDVSILQDIVSGKNTYQSNSDETYSKMVTYLNSDTFKSNTSIQNWYKEIHSSSCTSTNQSTTSEYAINELSTLNDRVTKSIDSMEEYSNYVLDSITKGSEVVKQIQQSSKENTNYHLTETQITELQKTITVYQMIQSITISNKSTTSTTVTNAEQTITSEVGNAKNQINEECTKVAESIKSLSDETSIKKAVDDNVCKVEQYYGQVKGKVQSQLNETSSSFFNNLQSFSTTLNTQSKSETSTMIQDIVEGKNTCQVDNDQSLNDVVIYLNSDSFKSNKVVQNLYQNIQSDTSTSTSTNYSEQAINHVNTLNNNVSKSVDSMQENSKYILDTMKKGSEVIQQIQESTKQDSNYKITQEQVIILKKCITIYQTIKTVITTTTTTTTSTTTTSNDEKFNKTDANVNQTNDASQNSVVSNVGRSIADAFGMGSENEKTDDSKKEDTTVVKNLDAKENVDSAINHSSTNGEQSSTDTVKINTEGDVDACSSTSISNTQQKITTNVSNAKTQINDEFTKTSQSLSSMSDETSIKQAVDENVQKVDKYYSEAKKEVQSQLTQTTSSFFKSCQKASKNLKTQNSQSNSVLQEIINDKTTYQADDDENFKQVLSYLDSDSFKSSSSVQNWYKEIHSDTSTSNLSKQSVDELGNLNGRVTESVDKMENHSKYILDTMKQGSEILKQIEDSSKQNVKYELTQNQIIILKKCITIYQIIETITTTTTTTTNTVSVKNNSVTDHSVASDDEYEYDIEVKKNTKEVVQVEETKQEDKVAVNQKDASGSNSSGIIKTQTNDEKKAAIDSSSNSVSNDSVTHEASNNETRSLDAQVAGTNTSTMSTSNNTVQKGDETEAISSNSSANENTVSKKNEKSEVKKASHASKVDRLKKFTQEETTTSKTSLTTLMVNWTVTKSTTVGIPNTCDSLDWNKYFTHNDEDENTIKEISDLLAVGRSVIEDSIELKKEKLPLYRDIHEIEMMVVSCTEIVDEILLQLSEVVGQDVQDLKISFNDSLKKNVGPDASKVLSDKAPTLDQELLSAASTFFSMKDSKKTDLLNQINKQFTNVQINDEKQAREIATKKFDKLQSIMKTVLDNIDCLVLRVVDTIENAKHSMTCLKNDDNSYIYVKNGQVLCDIVKIPPS